MPNSSSIRASKTGSNITLNSSASTDLMYFSMQSVEDRSHKNWLQTSNREVRSTSMENWQTNHLPWANQWSPYKEPQFQTSCYSSGTWEYQMKIERTSKVNIQACWRTSCLLLLSNRSNFHRYLSSGYRQRKEQLRVNLRLLFDLCWIELE